MLRIIILLISLAVSAGLSLPVSAEDDGVAKLTFGENKWIAVHFLLQAQAQSASVYGSGETKSDAVWSKSVFLRRCRIILKGQATENITFFMETDDFNIGSGDNTENGANNVFTQDAYINYKAADELQIAAGLILLPFMHNNRQSAASLLGVDYNIAVVPLGGISNVWRDTGVEARGLLFKTSAGKKGLIDYRIGAFQGISKDDKDTADTSDDINPHDHPRYCGRVQVNLIEPETGFFYSGNYLGKKKIVSVGVGGDYQNHALRDDAGKLDAYIAWTVDMIIDYALGDGTAIALQGAYVRSKNKPEDTVVHQHGYFAQAGILINGKIQVIGKYLAWTRERADADPATLSKNDNEKAYIIAGVNYFFNGHNANIKAEYQQPLEDDHKDKSGEKKAIIQCQIFI